MINALSVDLEEWYHAITPLNSGEWDRYTSRIVYETEKLLMLFDAYGVKATFFALGYIADRFPSLLERIVSKGHELGSHGYMHKLLYSMTPEEFEEDLSNSLEAISRNTGIHPIGYRAPMFSITEDSLWALEILANNGIKYDSSIYPFKNPVFGIADAEQSIHELNTRTGKILEFPPSVVSVFGKALPFCGGFFLRSLPAMLIKQAIKKNNSEGRPVMLYIHPFEIDDNTPVHKKLNLIRKTVHYHNLHTTEEKLRKLLAGFSFSTVSEVLGL